MQECYAVGDFSRALSIAEEILARTPDDVVVRKCAQNCREVLTQMFAARIGPTVCELDGPTPMEKSSKAETYAVTTPTLRRLRRTRRAC